MFNESKLNAALVEYKKEFATNWSKEKYKWEAVKHFQDNWDENAIDFAEMLNKALSKTKNLLTSREYYPLLMIKEFVKRDPNYVRAMFSELYDEEGKDLCARIENFKEKAGILLSKYGGGKAKQHYQNENAISTYLWLRYPDKYYIYKIGEVKNVSVALGSGYTFKSGAYAANIRNFIDFYNEICDALNQDKELKKMLASRLTSSCYSDPELKTLTIDVAHFIGSRSKSATAPRSAIVSKSALGSKSTDLSKENSPEKSKENIPVSNVAGINYWFLNANPKMWSMSGMPVGQAQNYTLYNDNGNKRRIFQNFLDAKAGDMVIGYESTPVKQIVALMRVSSGQDGKNICFEKLEGLSSPIDYGALKGCPELENMEYFVSQQGSLFKLTKDEYEFILDMIREENPASSETGKDKYTKEDFLKEVFITEAKYDRLVSVLKKKKNIIMQGAPGVGKTFAAKRLAYSIMGEVDEDRIEFVQFHQNYSYEDFVMGYKPVDNGFELKYGVFYRFCQKVANHPDQDYFFIIDEINRGNMSKIFGELLMLIETDYRGKKVTLAYNGLSFFVPKNLHIIGMMNTADRSLAMIDYALRRRFSFFDMEPGFDSDGFKDYQKGLKNATFDTLIARIKDLNTEITKDKSLGKGFCIGHSYFCGADKYKCTDEWMQDIVDYDILPMLGEYWFDDDEKVQHWTDILQGVFQ